MKANNTLANSLKLRINNNFGSDCACENYSYDVIFTKTSETINTITYTANDNQEYCDGTGYVASGTITFNCVAGYSMLVTGTVVTTGASGETFNDQNCPKTITLNNLTTCQPSISTTWPQYIAAGDSNISGEESPIPSWFLYSS